VEKSFFHLKEKELSYKGCVLPTAVAMAFERPQQYLLWRCTYYGIPGCYLSAGQLNSLDQWKWIPYLPQQVPFRYIHCWWHLSSKCASSCYI